MKDIKGFEGLYAITKDGRVWAYPRIITQLHRTGKLMKRKWKGKWLATNTTKKGDWYMSIALQKDNFKIRKGFKIHRLVAEAFIPNPKNLPEVNHKNGIKTDNRIENLEWVTHQRNIDHSWEFLPKRNFPRGEKNWNSRLTEEKVREIKRLKKAGISGRKLSPLFGVSAVTINCIARGIYWKHII